MSERRDVGGGCGAYAAVVVFVYIWCYADRSSLEENALRIGQVKDI